MVEPRPAKDEGGDGGQAGKSAPEDRTQLTRKAVGPAVIRLMHLVTPVET